MKKYQIIYADPPWHFGDRVRSKGMGGYFYSLEDKHYKTMKTEEICNLPIKELASEQSILFLWTTDAHIPDALKVIDGWGFKYKTVAFHWLKKEKSGKNVCFMSKWTMKSSEICLLATRGTAHKLLKARNIRQLVEAERSTHSRKPQEIRDRIVQMFGNELSKVELFARQKTDGWDVWGNEVESNIKL